MQIETENIIAEYKEKRVFGEIALMDPKNKI